MIGTALRHHLLEQCYAVSGISRATTGSRLGLCAHYLGDILDRHFLEKAFSDFKPDTVYHLAAQAFNGESYLREDTTYLTNIQGTRNVLDVCRKVVPNAKIILACSSAEYGIVSKQPITEDTPLHPITPYGVTKATTEMMGMQYAMNYDMDIVFPRLFIQVGTGHPPFTFIQNIAKQYALYKKGIIRDVKCGNLFFMRDYLDVRDGVVALEKMAYMSGVYNVCSGVEYSGHDIIKLFSKVSGINPDIVAGVSAYMRPTDESRLLGDNTKLRSLGWSPQYSIEQTIESVYNDWLGRI